MEIWTKESMEHRVDTGARMLDERHPGWYREIDTKTLDISKGASCMCGQLYKSYRQGLKKLGFLAHDAQDHGFIGGNTQELTRFWLREIGIRKLAEEVVATDDSGVRTEELAGVGSA